MPRLEGLDLVDRLSPRPEAPDDRDLREVHVHAVVDHVAGDDEVEVRDVQDGGVVAVGGAGLDDHEVVALEREPVVGHRHGRDRRRRDPRIDLVPQHRSRGDAGVHLGDRPRRGDDARPEPLGQHPGGEPVIAMAVGDEDVGDVAPLRGDPVADQVRLVRCQRRVGQHCVLAAVDQRARLGREPLRLAVRQDAVLRRRLVDEDLVRQGLAHGFGSAHRGLRRGRREDRSPRARSRPSTPGSAPGPVAIRNQTRWPVRQARIPRPPPSRSRFRMRGSRRSTRAPTGPWRIPCRPAHTRSSPC